MVVDLPHREKKYFIKRERGEGDCVDGVGGFVSKDSKKAWQKPLFTV